MGGKMFDNLIYKEGHLYRRAGSTDKGGYTRVKINGKTYLEHRLVWLLHKGVWPTGQLDHINGDRSDNRIENLREASNGQNRANSKVNKNNLSTGIEGIYLQGNRYKVVCGGKYCGLYTDLEEAKDVYRYWSQELWGEYAKAT